MASLRRFALNDTLLVAARDDAGRAQDCLAQPPPAQQQPKNTDAELQCLLRHVLQASTASVSEARNAAETAGALEVQVVMRCACECS